MNENESVGVAHYCEFSWQLSLQDCALRWDKVVESCQWLATPCTVLSPFWLGSANLLYPPVHISLL